MSGREKLIELLGDDVCPAPCCEECDYKGSENACIRAMKESMADHLISNGVTVQKWIPVSERLPEEWKHVLVLLRTGGCEVAGHVEEERVWRVCWNHDFVEEYSVTHWMPLPEPPKECE